jgi:excisionase family DNA binding protein
MMHHDETVLAVGMAEAARRLGLSARTIAALVVRRELPSLKVGRRRIVPVAALEAFVRRDHGPGRTRRTEALQGSSGSTE